VSILLKAVEKGHDYWRIQCGNGERHWFGLQVLMGILKQQAKRIAVTGNGLRTDVLMLK
jgi:hypothetical protein